MTTHVGKISIPTFMETLWEKDHRKDGQTVSKKTDSDQMLVQLNKLLREDIMFFTKHMWGISDETYLN